MDYTQALPSLQKDPWLSITPRVTSFPGTRAPAYLDAALAQFCVGQNPRYRPHGGRTFCNIFVQDASKALGCEIPHWVAKDGYPALPEAPGAVEMLANMMPQWFQETAPWSGWSQVSELEAIRAAAKGEPAVVVWVNPSGPGHTGVLVPRPGVDPEPWVTQAGAVCGTFPLHGVFGGHRDLSFWRHP